MDGSARRLFHLLRENLAGGLADEGIIRLIKADEGLVEASNSYCARCGKCCNRYCGNKETLESGRIQCLLHDQGAYPYGKNIPEYPEDIDKKLDSAEFTKPSVCHTFGPHLAFLAGIRYSESGKAALATNALSLCDGAENMTRDYEAFLSEQIPHPIPNIPAIQCRP